MNNEKRNEFLSWRGRLDPMEGVPGQGLDDHEATWERLMDRFREKPRRRLPLYGIAAACLLLVLIPAARFFQDRSSRETVRPRGVQRATPLASHPDGGRQTFASSFPKVATSATGETSSDRQEERQMDRRAKRHVAGRQDAASAGTMKMALVVTAGDSLYSPEMLAAALQAPRPLAQQPVLQKKWKVVDLNELNSGWRPSSGMASNRHLGSLRIGWGSQETGASDEGTPPVRDPGIRIKLSTSN